VKELGQAPTALGFEILDLAAERGLVDALVASLIDRLTPASP
jgi:hypothetical protein